MYRTGNLQKNIKSLESLLKKVKYKDRLEMSMVESGDPRVFLPILNYVLLDYSSIIASLLNNNSYELFSKSDREFVKTTMLALINLFNYRPALSTDQFFKSGFAEGKTIFCCEVISIVSREHERLEKKMNSMNKIGIGSESKYIHNKASSFSNLGYTNSSQISNEMQTPDKGVFKKLENPTNFKTANNCKLEDPDEEYYNQRVEAHENYLYRSDSPKFASNININKSGFSNYQERCDEEEDENNYLTVQPVKVECNQTSNNQNIIHNLIESSSIKSPPNERSRNGEIEELIEIINTLASSVKDMTGRVDSFKLQIENRLASVETEVYNIKHKFVNLEAENTLLRNELILYTSGKAKWGLAGNMQNEKLDYTKGPNIKGNSNEGDNLYNFKKIKTILEQQEQGSNLQKEAAGSKAIEAISNKERLQDEDRLFSFAHNTLANEERSHEKVNWKAQSNNTIMSDFEVKNDTQGNFKYQASENSLCQDSQGYSTVKDKNNMSKKLNSFSDKLSKIELHFKTTSDMLKELK